MQMVSNNIVCGRDLGNAMELIVLVLFMVSSASALSNSGGGDWLFNKTVIINNTDGGALTDYQVLVNLNGGDFPTDAHTNGADIRFTDAGGAELSYWIESWDYSGRSAKIWVKVPSIPANAKTTICMYYGNPSALSSSSGTATFIFFDDFNDNNLDIAKWTFKVGTYAEQNQRLEVKGDGYAWSDVRSYEMELPLIWEATIHSGIFQGGAGWTVSTDGYIDASSGIYMDHWAFIAERGEWTGASPSYDTDYKYKEITRTNDVVAEWTRFSDGAVTIGTNAFRSPSSTTWVGIGQSAASPANAWIDDVRVRKYASPEPSTDIVPNPPSLKSPINGSELYNTIQFPDLNGIFRMKQQVMGYRYRQILTSLRR